LQVVVFSDGQNPLSTSRVSRFGEFSPFGRLPTVFVKFTEVAENLSAIFFHGKKLRIYFGNKPGWATFWAIFLQAHLVTLSTSHSPSKAM
jgi:hypothetical protein